MLKSLGLASDVLVQGGRSELTEFPDRFTLRTPTEPHYWFGNMVIFRDDVVTPEAQIAQFRADFPDAPHMVLAWDVPDMERGDRFADFAARGFDIDEADVLALRGPLVRGAEPEGIVIRPLASDDDWAQAADLQIETGLAEGYPPESYRPFVADRMAARRALAAEGLGTWFGAFDGDLLVADCGIYADDRVARFQSVETRDSHRRRGICAAMVTAGVDWATAHRPTATPVIVADQGSAAGRIYRRCGFTLEERLMAVVRGSH